MHDATFCPPDLTTFCRLDELGLVVVGQQVTASRTLLAARPLLCGQPAAIGIAMPPA